MKQNVVDRYTYRVVWSEEDQEFVGLCAEFPSLSWLDPDRTKALEGIVRTVRVAAKDMRSNGEDLPEPLNERQYSGELRLRMPSELHKRLAFEAAEKQTSLNRIIIDRLSG